MSKVHAILSDLHRLLSAYDRENFIEASRYPGLSRPLRNVLTALASEVPIGPYGSSPHQRRDRNESLETSNFGAETSTNRSVLVESIIKSRYAESVGSLVGFASNHGIRLNVRPKESKKRVAQRISQSLIAIPESKRNQILADLGGEVSSQTQGWINVIKGNKQ